MKARSPAGRGSRGRAALLLAGFVVFLTPGLAAAHAILVSSDPPPEARLGTAPGVVSLRFSEPLTPELSQATVTDPTGRRFTGNVSGSEISVFLATNAPGRYTVTWTSVSADDGHTEQGSFSFTVIAPSGPGNAAVSAAPGSPILLGTLRTVQYVALLMSVGILFVARLARRDPEVAWVRVRRSLAWVLLAALLAGIVVVLAEASAASDSSLPHGLAQYLTSGVPGTARIVLLVAEALALLSSLTPVAVWPFLLMALIGLAASGHGASAHPVWWGVTVDAGHLITAGLWAGGIMALATLRPPGGFGDEEGRRLLDRFTPVAITAFLGTVNLGALQAIHDVGTMHALFSTTYGQVLTVKIAAVAAMVPLSLLAWRRRLAPRAEAVLAVFVIGAAALLAAYPLPARGIAAARAEIGPIASRSPPSESSGVKITSALPSPGDLTLGDHAGQILVGLTVRPAEPGPNELLVYLQPLQGSANQIPVKVAVDDRHVPVHVCGSDCRVSQARLRGGERVTVTADDSTGGTVAFDLPKLPAPDGTMLLAEAQERMHALTTYRLDEVLNSGLVSLRSKYAAQAPDRLEITTGQTQSIFIGGTRYRKDGPDASWQVQTGGPPVPEPSFIWDYFKPFLDPRIVGAAMIEGVPTRIVAFAGVRQNLAIWFRLWIDGQGLVRQAHMRAVGHFMDHRYFDFDGPITIEPPVGSG
jgi:copper transport protein